MMDTTKLVLDTAEDLRSATEALHMLREETLVGAGQIERVDITRGMTRAQREAERRAHADLKAAVANAGNTEKVILLRDHLEHLSVDSMYRPDVQRRLIVAEQTLEREQRREAIRQERNTHKAWRDEQRRAMEQARADMRMLRSDGHLALRNEPELRLLGIDQPILPRSFAGPIDLRLYEALGPIRSPPQVTMSIDGNEVTVDASERKQTAFVLLKIAYMHAFRRASHVTGIRSDDE